MECLLWFSLLALALVVLPRFRLCRQLDSIAVQDNFTVSDIPWEGYNTMTFEWSVIPLFYIYLL